MELFNACLEHNDDGVRIALAELEQQHPDLKLYQPLAVLAAMELRADILKICIDKGATFEDRYLARKARKAARQDERVREVVAPFEETIGEYTKHRKNPDGSYTDEHVQEFAGGIHF